MKLYVDDLRKEPSGWVRAKTVTEAIRIIAMQDPEEISLDHDISHRINMDGIARPFPCGETFEPVAWFIREKYNHEIQGGRSSETLPKITLHTANPIGAKKMAEILADGGIASVTGLGMPVNGLE